MQAIASIATLLFFGIAIILIGNGLLGTLLGVRGALRRIFSSLYAWLHHGELFHRLM